MNDYTYCEGISGIYISARKIISQTLENHNDQKPISASGMPAGGTSPWFWMFSSLLETSGFCFHPLFFILITDKYVILLARKVILQHPKHQNINLRAAGSLASASIPKNPKCFLPSERDRYLQHSRYLQILSKHPQPPYLISALNHKLPFC